MYLPPKRVWCVAICVVQCKNVAIGVILMEFAHERGKKNGNEGTFPSAPEKHFFVQSEYTFVSPGNNPFVLQTWVPKESTQRNRVVLQTCKGSIKPTGYLMVLQMMMCEPQ